MNDFLKEQLKSEEFRREYEALEPDYEFVLRGDVDPRNLAFPIKPDGTEYSDYERGYNDGVIAAYWLTRNARKIEVEPVIHAHWVDRPDGAYRICTNCNCGVPTMQRPLAWFRCPVCGAHMDEGVSENV